MGLWVEVDSDLPDHPKSIRLAEILGEPRAWARVVQLWMWAVRYAPSGDLSPFTAGQIARAMGYEKGGPDNGADPVAALRECGVTGDRGFLDSDHKLHGWNERTGGKLKKRQRVKRLNRKRQSRHRHALVTRDKRTVPDLTVPDLTVPDLTVPDLIGSDRTAKPTSPGPAAPGTRDQGAGVFAQRRADEGFQAFWQTYPKKRSRGRALAAWKKALKERRLPELEHVLTALERLKASEDWRKEAGKYVPYPASWLNADGWEDQIGVSAEPPRETAGQRTERALKSFGFLKEKPA